MEGVQKNYMIKKRVIIDCDPGIDDSLALMLALNSDEIEVIGITIVCGNSPVEMGFENAKKVLHQIGRLDVPIYVGANQPLIKKYVNALDTHGEDGLGESFFENIPGYNTHESAVSFLARTLQEQPCSIIALGPLTNFALLIQENESAFNVIERFVSMGGTYRSHGNCSPVAEYNYWEDPEAAAIVYKQMEKIGKKIEMVGLDVTRKIVLTPNLLNYIERLDQQIGLLIRKITKFYFDFHWEQEHLIGCVINDPLAVAYFLDSSLCNGFSSHVDLVTDGIARGQTIVDAFDFYHSRPNAYVLTECHTLAFFKMFISRILHIDEKDLDLLEKIV